jgi:Zn-dependent protease with chaperone function
MTYTLHHALLVLACPLLAIVLVRARWTERAPRTAIIAWQGMGLAWGLSLIGTALATGLAPYQLGIVPGLARVVEDLGDGSLPRALDPAHLAALIAGLALAAVLVGMLVACAAETLRVRRRHREILALVARDHPETPGALVIDSPAAAAYCLPGLQAQVVISAGALRLLDRAEVEAVLAHERGHARGRHDLVLLPFAALLRLLPRSRLMGAASGAVSLLVELCADDYARRRRGAHPLAAALLRFGTTEHRLAPAGALGAAEGETVARARRLLSPQPSLPLAIQALILAAVALLVGTPVSLILLPA